jgi:nucleoid-associated protein YgaU
VRRADTLWDIVRRHLGPDASEAEVALAWPHWYAANRATIGDDPDLLLPGQVLQAPHPTRDRR